MEKKVKQVMNIAKNLIFFPFTEPIINSPFTGSKISGREQKKFNAQELIWGKKEVKK
jgi:hypothetical protein